MTDRSVARTNGRVIGLTAALILIAGAALAQQALDANLSPYGRLNPRVADQQMASPLYTVNRETGEMRYNRVNAFQDSAYAPYQRYTMDRIGYFNPYQGRSAVPSSRGAVSPQGYVDLGSRSGASLSSSWRPSSSAVSRSATRSTSGLGASRCSVTRSRGGSSRSSGGGLAQPAYRASSTRVNTSVRR